MVPWTRRQFCANAAPLGVGSCAALSAIACRSRVVKPGWSSHPKRVPALRHLHRSRLRHAIRGVRAASFRATRIPGAIDLGVPGVHRSMARHAGARLGARARRCGCCRWSTARRANATAARPSTRAPAEQDEILGLWQHGHDGSQRFFPAILSLTLEGAFGDPKYGGNSGGRGFAMIGFTPEPPLHKMSSMLPSRRCRHASGHSVSDGERSGRRRGRGQRGGRRARRLRAGERRARGRDPRQGPPLPRRGLRSRRDPDVPPDLLQRRRSPTSPTRCATARASRRPASTAGWVSSIVGGGTVHMAGYFHRLHPVDFKLRSTLGRRCARLDARRLADQLRGPGAVLRAGRERGRRHRACGARTRSRSRGRRLPACPRSRRTASRSRSTPPARSSAITRSRPLAPSSRGLPRAAMPCMFCALCASYGCEIGAKSSTLASLIPAAEATGHCEVRPECMASEIPVDCERARHGRRLSNGVRGDTRSSRRAASWSPARPSRARGCSCCRARRASPTVSPTATGSSGRTSCSPERPRARRCSSGRGARTSRGSTTRPPFVQRSLQDFYFLDRPDRRREEGRDHPLRAGAPEPHPHGRADRRLRQRRALGSRASSRRCATRRGAHDAHVRDVRRVPADSGHLRGPRPRREGPLGHAGRAHHARTATRSTPRPTGCWRRAARRCSMRSGPDSSHITQEDGQDMVLQGGTCRFGRTRPRACSTSTAAPTACPTSTSPTAPSCPRSGGVPPTLTIMANAFRVGSASRRGSRPGDLRTPSRYFVPLLLGGLSPARGRCQGCRFDDEQPHAMRHEPCAGGPRRRTLLGGERGLDHVGRRGQGSRCGDARLPRRSRLQPARRGQAPQRPSQRELLLLRRHVPGDTRLLGSRQGRVARRLHRHAHAARSSRC